MIDERLGRHSTLALTVLIPGMLIVAVLVDGMVHPGADYPAAVDASVFAIPPLAALGLGMLNGEGLLRSLLRAVVAAVLMLAWYAVLVLPFAAFCSLASGNSCM